MWRAKHADNRSSGYPHLLGLPLGLSLAVHLLVLAIWLTCLQPQQIPLAFPDTDLTIHLQNSLAKAEQKPINRFPARNNRESHLTGLKMATVAVSRSAEIKHARQTIIKPKAAVKPAKIKPAETTVTKKTTITAAQPFHTAYYKQARKPIARISLSRIISRLQHDLKQYFYYPRLARRENIQGAVILGFAINLQGEIKNIHLVKSSGFAILDDAAEDALRQLDRLNWEQDYLQRDNRHIELPVIYKLTES